MLDQITELLTKNSKHVITASRIKALEDWPKLISDGFSHTGEPIYVSEAVEAKGAEARERLREQMAKATMAWINRRAKDIDAAKVYVHVVYRDFFTDTLVKGEYEKHSAELKFRLHVSHAPIQL